MPVKLRLARHGRKRAPFYYIVAADSRAPRDGRYIERIGSYNPNTAPATIDLDIDKALMWLNAGAQPTDTCRSILSYKGVMYKKHLLKGVAKGAITEEQSEEKFQTWITAKEAKIDAVKVSKEEADKKQVEKMLAAEVEINNARAEAIAKKLAKSIEAEQVVETSEEVADEVKEEILEEVKEEVKEKVLEETKAEVKKEEK